MNSTVSLTSTVLGPICRRLQYCTAAILLVVILTAATADWTDEVKLCRTGGHSLEMPRVLRSSTIAEMDHRRGGACRADSRPCRSCEFRSAGLFGSSSLSDRRTHHQDASRPRSSNAADETYPAARNQKIVEEL